MTYRKTPKERTAIWLNDKRLTVTEYEPYSDYVMGYTDALRSAHPGEHVYVEVVYELMVSSDRVDGPFEVYVVCGFLEAARLLALDGQSHTVLPMLRALLRDHNLRDTEIIQLLHDYCQEIPEVKP